MKVRGSKVTLAMINNYKPRIAEELRALQHVLEVSLLKIRSRAIVLNFQKGQPAVQRLVAHNLSVPLTLLT